MMPVLASGKNEHPKNLMSHISIKKYQNKFKAS